VLIEQLDGAVERVRQAARRESGRLVAGFLGSTAHWLAPEIARSWHERRPEVRLEVEEIALDEQLAGLASGQLDVAFVRPPTDVAGFRSVEMAEEPVCAVLPVDHPLATRSRLALEELSLETWVMLLPYEQPMVGWALERGFTPHVAERARSVNTYLILIAAGIGIGLMPWSARNMRGGDVVFVPLEGRSTSLLMVWRDEPETAPLLELLEVARAAVDDIVPVSKTT
jgi:DNA-binding transcriptional LysR family regulator